jgi:hypothetical protein
MITNQLSFGVIKLFNKTDYVHNNPIEEGLVYKPEDYVYSSAIDYAGQKV